MSPEELMAEGSVTISQAVREFGIGRSKLYELMTDGELPFAKMPSKAGGGRRLIPRVALKRYIASKLVCMPQFNSQLSS